MAKKNPEPQQEVAENAQANEAQIAKVETSSIAEFNPFLAELERLKKEYGAVVYDVTKPADFENAKKARKDIRDVRYAAQKAAAEIIKPYQQKVKDAQEKVRDAKAVGEDLIDKVLLLETPIDDQIKVEEKRVSDEKERVAAIERERVEAIQAKISRFRNVSVEFGSSNAADLAIALERVNAAAITEEAYGEFEGEATIARDSAITQLTTLHTLAVSREAEAARVERERKELEELREKNRITEENAQRERDQRAKEDRERMDREKAELDRQRDQLVADKAELEKLRAATPASVQVAPTPVASVVQAPAVELATPETAQEAPSDMPSFDQIAEVVALGFGVEQEVASTWLRSIKG